MKTITGLDYKIMEMAGRIKELREIEGYSVAYMAQKTGVSEEEYLCCENGGCDLNFAFIYRCASAFNVDVTNIIEGHKDVLLNVIGAVIKNQVHIIYHALNIIQIENLILIIAVVVVGINIYYYV